MFRDPDFLITIKKTCWVWFESKMTIYSARIAALVIHVYIVMLCYDIYHNGIDLNYVLSYGANVFSYIFFIIISYTYIFQRTTMKTMEKYMQEHFKPFCSKGKNTEKQIGRKIRIGRNISYIQFFFCIISLISMLPINSNRSEILYIIMIISKSNITFFIQIFNWMIFYYVHFVAFEIVFSYANVMLYFILHLHFQYILLKEDCRQLENGLNSFSYLEEDTREYHRIIENRIASMIRHYQIIDRYQILVQNLFSRPLFLVIWFGLFDFMFVSYLLVKVDLGPDILLVFVIWLAVVEMALHLMVYGQIHADQREELRSVLMDCHWFNWNNRNKKTYQMLLTHLNQQRLIAPGGIMILDLSFLIWFGRKTVSAVAFLSTMDEINRMN